MTNSNDKNLQQQIMFDDTDIEIEPGSSQFKETNVVTEQVVFENSDYLPLTPNDSGFEEVRESELNAEHLQHDVNALKKSHYSWLWVTITCSFLTIIAIEAFDFFSSGFTHSPIITSIYALLLTAISLVAGKSVWRELIGLRQFKKRQNLKQQASEFFDNTTELEDESNVKGKEFCQKISDNLPCDLIFDSSKDQDAWHEALTSDHNSTELVQLYSRVVLSKVDEKALNEVAKFSTEAVVLVALSPVAIIDMLIMLSRNLRMINKVAGLYGLKLGYWSRIKLIKQVFVNMAYAGASELIADFGSDMLGAELLGKLSARFAQGLGAGMLTARLGAKTMELCRPIPFDEPPKLTHVRKKIAKQIKTLVLAK